MANFYTVDKEINGVKYVCQFNGISAALRALDGSYIEGSSNISIEKLSNYLFEHVVIEPKGLTADDFDSIDDFNAVTAFAREVMQGNIKPAEKKSKKDE